MWKAKPGEEKWLARDSMARNQQNQDSNANVDFKAYNSLIWLLNITQCITLVVLQSLIVSDSLRPHGLQYSGLPSPPLSLGVHSNSCPLSQLCHPTISSSVVFFSSWLQSFLASGSFLVSQLFRKPKYWSFSFSISPSNEYSGLISFRIVWFDFLAVQVIL